LGRTEGLNQAALVATYVVDYASGVLLDADLLAI
jgi:hypothetical protein